MAEVVTIQRQPSRYRARRPTAPSSQPIKIDTTPEKEKTFATRSMSMSRYRKARPAVVPAQLETAVESRKSQDAGQSETLAAAARAIEANENLVFLPNLRKDPEERFPPVMAASPPSKSPVSPVKEFFGFFRRKSSKNLSKSVKATSEPVPVRQRSPPAPTVQTKVEREAFVTQEMAANGLGVDAPVSAINAGERRVLVRCKDSSISLPVLPTTSCVELVYSASNCLAQNIEPSRSILVESLPELGLSRAVRRYEHVRDILNSWDRDTQHGLMVEAAGADELSALEAKFVPKKTPTEQSAYLYHCHKPGKWVKVWVTIRSDGQVLMRKKQSTVKEKDISKVCHLSDSDIYKLTNALERQLRRPKKAIVCFAVKSQQKGSMFQDKSSYVHYFSTDDRQLGQDFFAAVRDWRSWYLVNMLGEGVRPTTAKKAHPTKKKDVVLDIEDRYQIGTFEPLMDASEMNFRKSMPPPPFLPNSVTSNRLSSEQTPRSGQRKTTTKGYYPPTAMPVKQGSGDSYNEQRNSTSSLTHTGPRDDEAENTFAPSGLLGRTYSQRQAAVKEREASAKRDSGAFVSGGNLINRMSTEIQPGAGGISRTSSMRSKRNSTQATGKPLLNFGNAELETIKDPPQFSRKGRGYAPLTDDAPLVESARHVDSSVAVPYSFSNSSPPKTGVSSAPAPAPTNYAGRTSSDQRRGAPRSTAQIVNPFRDDIHRRNEAFTQGPTLLSSLSTSAPHQQRRQDGVPSGRARSGTAGRSNAPGTSHGNGPLLDVSEKPLFANGSLLARV